MIRGTGYVVACMVLALFAMAGTAQTLASVLKFSEGRPAPFWFEGVSYMGGALLVAGVCRGARRRGFDDGEIKAIKDEMAAEAGHDPQGSMAG